MQYIIVRFVTYRRLISHFVIIIRSYIDCLFEQFLYAPSSYIYSFVTSIFNVPISAASDYLFKDPSQMIGASDRCIYIPAACPSRRSSFSSWPSTLDIPLPIVTNRSPTRDSRYEFAFAHAFADATITTITTTTISITAATTTTTTNTIEQWKQQRARVVSNPLSVAAKAGWRQEGRGGRGEAERALGRSLVVARRPTSTTKAHSPPRLTPERNSWKLAPAPWRHLYHPCAGRGSDFTLSSRVPPRPPPQSRDAPRDARSRTRRRRRSSYVSLSSSVVPSRWCTRRSEGGVESRRAPPSPPRIPSRRRSSRRDFSGREYATGDIGGQVVAILLRHDGASSERVSATTTTVRGGDMLVGVTYVPGLFFDNGRRWRDRAITPAPRKVARSSVCSLSFSLSLTPVVLVWLRGSLNQG